MLLHGCTCHKPYPHAEIGTQRDCIDDEVRLLAAGQTRPASDSLIRKGSVNVSGAANPKPKPNAEQAAPCPPGPTVATVTNDVPDPASMRALTGIERQKEYAKELRLKGMDVVENGKAQGADFIVNGKPLEYTTVNSDGKNTIINALENKLSIKWRPNEVQSPILHIDARWSGQSSEKAQAALDLAKSKGYLDRAEEVYILTDNGTVIWRRGE